MQETGRARRKTKKRWSPRQVGRSLTALTACDEAILNRDPLARFLCYCRRLSDAYATHQCSLMACACAYCALLSLVPLLVVGIAAFGFVLGGSRNALEQVLDALRDYIPNDPQFLATVNGILVHILNDRRLIGIFGITGLLFAAHQAFLSMQPAMNLIWNVKETRHWLRLRVIAVLAVFYALALLAGVLAASWLFATLANQAVPFVPNGLLAHLLALASGLLPMLLTILLFAMLYRFLPNADVPWKAAFMGAGVAALLWQLTLVGFGLYLARFHTYDRLYGSLGGLVILVVWAYYSMAILLLGAEVAADYDTLRHGMRAAQARAHSAADLAQASGAASRHPDPDSPPPADREPSA